MIKIGNDDIVDIKIGANQVNEIYLGNALVFENYVEPVEPIYELYMWLDGTDAPVSSKWVDKTGGLEWAISKATHGSDYYEFLNSTTSTASQFVYYTGGGAVIDLGKHWKVVADVAIASDTQNGYILDMCSYVTTTNGYNGLGFIFHKTYGANSNVKIDGNTTTTQNTASGVTVSLPNTWNRMTLTWECAPARTRGYSVISSYMDGTLCRYTNKFADIDWKNFRASNSPFQTLYIGRGFLNTSSNHAPLRFRLYDLKMYKRTN